jgi:hypothetical protein
MTNSTVPSISSYRARSLSFKQIEAWSAAGASHREELQRIVNDIVRSLHNSSSPAKSLNAAKKKLESLFSRREVRGKLNLLNSRHINFRLAFPTSSDDGLVFCLLYGEINARTGAVKFDLTRPIQISLHALQRLFERLNEISEAAVLDEIYSCIGQVIHWHKGATEINAKSWPLMSENGFFIGTSTAESLTTTVVTWIKRTSNGKKWAMPLANLLRLKEHNPDRLEDSEFAQEFIRSFPWMLHEHVPGEDLIASAWEHKGDQDNGSPHDESDWEERLEKVGGDSALLPKLSASYISGLNYRDDPPGFKTHTLHSGVVVQRRADGGLIVGMKNGWVGKIPCISIKRGVQLISGYKPPEIGEDVTVLVHKITHFPKENAFAISLDPKDVSDENWSNVEKQHVVGSFCSVKLLNQYKQDFMAQLESGIRGVIPSADVHMYLSQQKFSGCGPMGQTVDTVVTGYRPEKKCLLLSIRNINEISSTQSQTDLYQPGAKLQGKCILNTSNYSYIELPHGTCGVLYELNNWGRQLPAVGNDIPVVFVGTTNSKLILAGEPPTSIDRAFYAWPHTEEKWEQFKNRHFVGDVIEVQNLYWRENAQSYMVVTSDGIAGLLPATEVDWFTVAREEQKLLIKPGDIFKTIIIKIHSTKHRVTFSKKALDKNLTDEQLSKIHLGTAVQGLVVNVLDYGCFVQLQSYGIQGLLHRSKIPDMSVLKKGDVFDVTIDSIDVIKRRVSLSIAQNPEADASLANIIFN